MDEYVYLQKFNPGLLGVQPHNFVIEDGEQMWEQSYRIPKFDHNYNWLDTKLQIQDDQNFTHSPGKNIVVNLRDAELNLLMLNEYNFTVEDILDIDYIGLVGLNQDPPQIVKLSNLGKY